MQATEPRTRAPPSPPDPVLTGRTRGEFSERRPRFDCSRTRDVDTRKERSNLGGRDNRLAFRQSAPSGRRKCQLGSILKCSVQPHWLWESPPPRFGLKSASANIFFDFSGTCDGNGCPTKSDMATAVITLTRRLCVRPTDVTSATFISIVIFEQRAGPFEITTADLPLFLVQGDSNADGSL